MNGRHNAIATCLAAVVLAGAVAHAETKPRGAGQHGGDSGFMHVCR